MTTKEPGLTTKSLVNCQATVSIKRDLTSQSNALCYA